MRTRIALCGFSEFEYRAMRFSVQHSAAPASARYEVIDALAEADFAVVDGASASAVKGIVQAGFADRAVFIGGAAPAGARAHLSRPIDTARILRSLDELAAAHAAAGGRRPEARAGAAAEAPVPPFAFADDAAPALPIVTELPILSDVVAEPFDPFRSFDPRRRLPSRDELAGAPPDVASETALYASFEDRRHSRAAPPAPPPAARPSAALPSAALSAASPSAARSPGRQPMPSGAAGASPAAGRRAGDRPAGPPLDPNDPAAILHAAKVEARGKARRARIASDPSASVEPLRGALVVGPDAEANIALCTLLERFGFRPAALSTPLQARQLLADRQPALAAVFLDLSLDDSGLALVQAIKEQPVAPGHPVPAVHLVAASLGPADKVRVALAGLPEPLIKPLSRGDVARALERSGVRLPSDARRH